MEDLPSVKDVYSKKVNSALTSMGDYVYAYYRPGEFHPFYVGKGKNSRVLDHWKNAIKKERPEKKQEKEIRRILESKKLPTIKLLAYNLQKTKEDVNSVAERVLQDAFGIQSVWEKRGGVERLNVKEGQLLQEREDSSRYPVLSLDAVIAKEMAEQYEEMKLDDLVNKLGAPILLVGLSKTYHSSYSREQLAEMARMYWNLDKYNKNGKLDILNKAKNSVLLAWTSKLNKSPTIVGAWQIKRGSCKSEDGRDAFEVVTDLDLHNKCIGIKLDGTGNKYQGPRIKIPLSE